MTDAFPLWQLDPDDPRAPEQEIWDRMTAAQRAEVVASLPFEFPVSEANPPEGDFHYEAYSESRETLSHWFRQRGRDVYVSGNLPVYYPGERMFSPDVIAVVDVSPHKRNSWIVANEGGRGLDFAVEVIVSGNRRKDLRTNVERYARLGIQEYFVFDHTRSLLQAYRLVEDGHYERIMPQVGRYPSTVLNLDLSIENGSLRFAVGDAALLPPRELVSKLGNLVNDATARALELEAALEEEQRKREEEQRKREEEQRKREEAEAEVRALRAEIERLRSRQ